MVIWTRWGILGLLIPVGLIVIAMIGTEAIAKQQSRHEERKPVEQVQAAGGVEETPSDEVPRMLKRLSINGPTTTPQADR